MRGSGHIAVLVGVAALAAPIAALADQEIVAATPNRYVNTNVTMDQGEKLTFRNTDVAMHDVTEDPSGGSLFASKTIGQGETSFVEGSQYLSTGTYNFICSVHPDQMKGVLSVTANGTPAPRPGSGGPPPAADTTSPVLSLSTGKLRASKLKKSRKLVVTAGADEAAKIAITVKIGSKRAGAGRLDLDSAGTRRVEIRLGASARKALKRGRKLTISAAGTDGAGNEATAKLSVKLG